MNLPNHSIDCKFKQKTNIYNQKNLSAKKNLKKNIPMSPHYQDCIKDKLEIKITGSTEKH